MNWGVAFLTVTDFTECITVQLVLCSSPQVGIYVVTTM